MASCVQLGFAWDLPVVEPVLESQFMPVDEDPKSPPTHEKEGFPQESRRIRRREFGEDEAPAPAEPGRLPEGKTLSEGTPNRIAPPVGGDRRQVVQALQAQIARGGTARGRPASSPADKVSVREQLFPPGGIPRGITLEWIAMQSGSMAAYVAWLVACHALQQDASDRMLVVVDRRGVFYPPAAVSIGAAAKRLIVIRPANDADAMWAIDQALRCPAVCCVWSELTRLDDRTARRLQLAAEQSGGLGLWVRPASALSEPNWADARWKVSGVPAKQGGRHLNLELVRCRVGRAGASAMFEIDETTGQLHELAAGRFHDATGAVRLAAELAHPTSTRRTGERTMRRA